MTEFVHLHNHTDYSLLDGACTVKTLVDAAVKQGMPAVALTDHGNMFGAIEFYQYAREKGIKPIIGCEVYVAPRSRFEKSAAAEKEWGRYYHLVLLAKNNTGYRNLLKLVTDGYMEGFYYRPRIDKEILNAHKEGLIALSSCLKGEVSQKLAEGNMEAARNAALEYKSIFNGNFYLEIQNHGLGDEVKVMNTMPELAAELGIGMIGTNDCHYIQKDHSEAHDVLLCLQTGKTLADEKRLRYPTQEFYFKSAEEMSEAFADYPEATSGTLEIAEQCDIELELDKLHMPLFPIPDDQESPEAFLESLVEEGIRNRYDKVDDVLRERISRELDTINSMGYAGYFLIVNDFIRYAKEHGIPVGPGRGSAAGSVVSYALGITDVDPLKYDLIFERFLNRDRISMPDIDIDFCYERRGEVISYIKERYGEDSVTQIITFGTMKARAVIRDVGRVLGMSYADVDTIAKYVPLGPNVTLKDALEHVPDLKGIEKKDEVHERLIRYSLILEGMSRHASTHAAGVVIAPGKLTDYVPLYKTGADEVTTQYDMKMLDSIGLLKMDFLGLRTLTVLDNTVKRLREEGIEIDLENLQTDRPEVYKLFSEGKTIGIFQFESDGMRSCLRKLKPTVIEDLIAVNALYRPGPMENIGDFIDRKHGRKKIEYMHPGLEPILKETYGIIVYQEQVIRIANEIAGMSLSQADIMRAAMGKKKHKLMKEQRKHFVESALANDLKKKLAEKLFEHLAKFAGYGFNKSHSTAYALIAYRTGYLKANHPEEFMAATMSSEMMDTDRLKTFKNECINMGLKIVPPDVSISDVTFKAEKGRIIYALAALKNVGVKAAESIVKAREEHGPFETIFDLVKHLDLRLVNKKVLESLVCAGALDSLYGTRAAKFESISRALSYAQRHQAEVSRGQTNLFGNGGESTSYEGETPVFMSVKEWSSDERTKNERGAFGFHLMGHPLDKFADEVTSFTNFMPGEAPPDYADKVRAAGLLSEARVIFDKKRRQMAFCTLESADEGTTELVVFADVFEKYKDFIKPDNMVLVSGNISKRDEADVKIIATEFMPLEDVRNKLAHRVAVKIDHLSNGSEIIESIHEVAMKHPGNCELDFVFTLSDGSERKLTSEKMKVSPDHDFTEKLKEILGEKSVRLVNSMGR